MSIINTKGEIKNKKKSITNYTYYVSNYNGFGYWKLFSLQYPKGN